jgi:uncharacterized protein (DUF4415 family)
MNDSKIVFQMKAEYDFSGAVRGRFHQPRKVSTSIRLDDDILLYFRKKASQEKTGYQTLMNQALRDWILHHQD